MHPMLNIALRAARKGGDVILHAMERLNTINPSQKGFKDFVSDVDKKAEMEIISILQKTYPDHEIIAEESGLHAGKGKTKADSVWLIDPLDGTHNYLKGYPHFSVSIGFQHKGILEHGLVYDPLLQEIFTATRGEGARINDAKRLRVSTTTKLEDALLGIGFPVRYPEHLAQDLNVLQKLMPKISNVRCSGSAALDLAYVAAGRLDGFLESNLKPWDIAAGALLVKEAGGLVSDWTGAEQYLKVGNIVAGTPKVFSSLLRYTAK